jgi:ferredoxin-NADP reductase
MSNLNVERVLSVHHWNDTLFSFKTTRNPGLRFENGQFVMIGLEVEGRPLMRAYSIASPNYEEHLEFFSIKVPDGPLTSRLQHLKEGDSLMVSRKPTGTLVLDDLLPAKHLYLLSTGTGPFENQGRLTDLMRSGKLFADIGLPPINPEDDRAMICGSPSMLAETSEVLDSFGLKASPRMGDPGHYLIERAFVEK